MVLRPRLGESFVPRAGPAHFWYSESTMRLGKDLCLLGTLFLCACAQRDAAYHSWAVYGGGVDQIRYSPLDQINRGNVSGLRQAWVFDTGDAFPGSEMQCNPIVVDGILYAASPKLRVIALDAARGSLRWSFDPFEGREVRNRQRVRGLVHWSDGAERRIYFGAGHDLWALDAATGRPATGFGTGGKVDLREGLGRDPGALSVTLTTPGWFSGTC